MARYLSTMTAAIMSLVFAGLLQGQEQPSSLALRSPDYSEETLLRVLRNDDVTLEVYEDRIELRWAEWVLRFLPITLPLTANDGAYGRAEIFPRVSGLALLGLDYPRVGPAGDETPPFDLTWSERRFRWRMIGRVNAANASDNR